MGKISEKVEEAKSWYQSKTIIGVILAFIPTIVRLIKPEASIDLEGVIEEGFNGAEIIAQTADGIIATALEVFGSVLAIWGRIKAKVSLK